MYIKISRNLSAKYYQENKKHCQNSSRKISNLSKEEKEIKRKYCEQNLSDDEKQKAC